MERVVHGSERISTIIEAQRKLPVNFSNLHLLETEKFDNCTLLEFHPE
jgi:hypothetical protein